jgi:hypothetical protein
LIPKSTSPVVVPPEKKPRNKSFNFTYDYLDRLATSIITEKIEAYFKKTSSS